MRDLISERIISRSCSVALCHREIKKEGSNENEVKFHISDADTYETIADTEAISFDVN